MQYAIIKNGQSLSFSDADGFHAKASTAENSAVVIYSGVAVRPDQAKTAILVELGNECLAEHLGGIEENGQINILGFARYCNGNDSPSNLVEVVRQPNAGDAAIAAAKNLFENAGLQVAISADQIGRIINRLVLPKYNAALRFLDEGLASQADMDLTCKLGLGYPDGPIERVLKGGLEHHYAVTKALFDTYGTPAYAPPRRAVVAFNREHADAKKRR
ncbi:MAG: 3-hydroxyacyl-CoA dehydrogenase family protein [Afipia sp.]|nr:3-hydroxyacyl-CoA dehydrogenase family protein [Afipia sp.]